MSKNSTNKTTSSRPRKATKAERMQQEREQRQAEYEARAAKAAEEKAKVLAKYVDKIEEYKVLFQTTAVAALNAALASYTPKTTDGHDRFRVQFVCYSGSFGFRIRDYCHNSIDLSVVTEIGFLRSDVTEINHSTSGAKSMEHIVEFANALTDMAALGNLLREKLEPVAAIYRQAESLDDAASKGTEYDYRVLNAAADAVRPVVCDYIRMRAL